MKTIYEIRYYATKYDEEIEEIIINNKPYDWGIYETEEEAIKEIKKFKDIQLENSYITCYDYETGEILWDNVWYSNDVVENKNHPKIKQIKDK